MPRLTFWLTILADVLILFAAWSLVVFVATGPWHWPLFWWAMAITAVALLANGAVPIWAAVVARRRGGRVAEWVRGRRLWWISQRLTLLTFGLFFGIVSAATGLGLLDVVYAVWVLLFLVVLPLALVPVFRARLQRARARGSGEPTP